LPLLFSDVRGALPLTAECRFEIATESTRFPGNFEISFQLGGKQTLTDIINAAWQVSDDLETARSLKLEPERWRELVNQMALKTCEVTEYHERLDS
jgi:hypothetical protein